MCKYVFTIVIVSLVASLSYPAIANDEYASIVLSFENNECVVFSWLPTDGERRKIEFRSPSRYSHGYHSCEVHIPLEQFEKYYKTCALSGLVNTRDQWFGSKPLGASFNGGEADGRDDIYWFEWSDAEYTHARFRCLLM